MRRVTTFAMALSMLLLAATAMAEQSTRQATQADIAQKAGVDTQDLTGPRTDVPGLISYQGTLTDASGAALDTTVSMTFRIWRDPYTILFKVWEETQPAVEVTNGLFDVLLGSVNAIPDSVFQDPDRWLGIKIGGDPELVPRQRIAAVGYSFRAAEADTADYARGVPGGSDGDWTISGSDIYSAVAGNVGIGTASPAVRLDVSGQINADSLYRLAGDVVLSEAGWGNLFVGRSAGLNNTGSDGTFVGQGAGTNNQGDRNTFVGTGAGNSNTTGYNNTFLGLAAGAMNQTGYENTLIGEGAGYYNTSGSGNVMVGRYAGMNDSSGTCNTLLGYEAGWGSQGGFANTSVGYYAGRLCGSGYYNTNIGAKAGYYNETGSGNVFIGYEAGMDETGSDKLYIANSRFDFDVLIYGDFSTDRVGIATLNPEASLHVPEGSDVTPGGGGYFIVGSTALTNIAMDNDEIMARYNGAVSSLFLNRDGGDIILNENGGDVGIGTNNPSYKLDVRGDRIQLREDATGDWINLRTDGGGLDLEFQGGSLYMQSTVAGENILLNPNSGNNVGIGLTTPNRSLYIAENVNGLSYPLKIDNYNGNWNVAAGLLFSAGGNGTPGGILDTARGKGALVYEYTASWNRGKFHFLQNADTDSTNPDLGDAVMTIVYDGKVGIGITSPTRKLWVNGDAGGSTTWYNDSDGRLKHDITPIENALDKVIRLRGVTFQWNETENHPAGTQMGLIAQEVKEVVPEVVEKKGEYYSLATANLVPVLIEAIKEQQRAIEEQASKIVALQAQLDALR